MKQEQFAAHFSTILSHWQRGDRSPQGPALLNVIERNPQAVINALAA